MIAHLVLMNLHDTSQAEVVTSKVRSLRHRVPGLAGIEGGASVISEANTWDLGFLMLFDGEESTIDYQSHPAHVQISQSIKPLLREMATCDLRFQMSINNK